MSVTFTRDMTEDEMEAVIDLVGEAGYFDERRILFDSIHTKESPQLRQLALRLQQTIDIEVNKMGDVRTLTDGTLYRLYLDGWHETGLKDQHLVSERIMPDICCVCDHYYHHSKFEPKCLKDEYGHRTLRIDDTHNLYRLRKPDGSLVTEEEIQELDTTDEHATCNYFERRDEWVVTNFNPPQPKEGEDMSATFGRDLDREEIQRVSKALDGVPAAADPRTILFDQMRQQIDGAELSQLARDLGTTVTVGVHKLGDEKTLANGRSFRLTSEGWLEVRQPPKQEVAALQQARAERIYREGERI